MTGGRYWLQLGLVALVAGFVAVAGGASGWSGQTADAHFEVPEPSVPAPGYGLWPANPEPVSAALHPTGSVIALAPEYDRKLFGPGATLYDAGLMVIVEAAPGTASHTGLVITLNGQPIPGATVTLTPSAGGRPITAVTDDDGSYAFVGTLRRPTGLGTTG